MPTNNHENERTPSAQNENSAMNPATHSSEEPLSEATLRDAAKVFLLDADGNKVRFGDLYKPPGRGKKQRTLIIFVRHFFCGSCQDYVRAVASSIPGPSQLPADTAIAIVGCGASSLIPQYINRTKCPFPIYTDPTRYLHALFGMKLTLDAGTHAPDYSTTSMFSLVTQGIAMTVSRLLKGDMLQSGNKWQNGGEILFEAEIPNEAEDGGEEVKVRVPFCHIMKNTRDHSEVSVLKTVIGLDEERV
ncbi:conserved hypothetical protein [Histoplasma capsulatum G186AR]|uniref:Uncharacterized protein n=2 Tax=Ajellomyces capsulatus TaxID=5037 RepID=C0NNJ4_AJECG|nr:uncharacterized protein HCBG_04724 [Histoplasma capsulatum G186AR]EEH06504.1 conserved hypothetical protein [Histoplasma capsulatum G186AR]KAG5304978.1 Peroxiredoxin (PRX)-like 2 family protein [Histoplasma capsulatum]QSS75937.1 Peroxiredoxin (PRX)-like 2 family protein [Histoplasma capsulatum G186AR]